MLRFSFTTKEGYVLASSRLNLVSGTSVNDTTKIAVAYRLGSVVFHGEVGVCPCLVLSGPRLGRECMTTVCEVPEFDVVDKDTSLRHSEHSLVAYLLSRFYHMTDNWSLSRRRNMCQFVIFNGLWAANPQA